MDAGRQYFNYVALFAAAMAVVLMPVVALNYVLGLRSLGGGSAVLAASAWQQSTHGVTYAPPLSNNRPFKSARLFDRLDGIDTVVFGSSTAMGITEAMFAPGMRIYNFAQTGNSLMTVIAEAEFLERTQPALRWFVIPLDWALGSLYQPGAPAAQTLARPGAGDADSAADVPVTERLRDALSLPRVRNLWAIMTGIARARTPAAAFREMFLQEAGDEYRCADGTPAKDYDTIFRGTCTGFRDDGSATFGNLEPLQPRRAEALIASAVVASSKYAVSLARTAGEPNAALLARIGDLARKLRARGGGVIMLLPPLIPGLEHALLGAPQTGVYLRRTKDALERWARAEGLAIIDGGQSERFDCKVAEFVDEHHALPQCYARIFSRYWHDLAAPAGVVPGLYHAH